MVVAAEWTSRVTTICVEMVLPAVAGLWLDRQLGTVMVFLLLGIVLGMTVGMIQLLRLASPSSNRHTGDAPQDESLPLPPDDKSES